MVSRTGTEIGGRMKPALRDIPKGSIVMEIKKKDVRME